MRGNIHKSVKSEQQRSNQRGHAKALVSSFLQWSDVAHEKNGARYNQQDRGPTQFRPQPKPVAFRVESTCIAKRRVTKNCEDRLEIPPTTSHPARRANT